MAKSALKSPRGRTRAQRLEITAGVHNEGGQTLFGGAVRQREYTALDL